MLKFFRNIRRRLLQSSNFRSYTFYAIGEIALVVVGILIALQINNWNEERHQRRLEKSTLMEINLALAQDTARAIAAIQRLQNSLDTISILIDYVESKKPYSSDLSDILLVAYTFHTVSFGKFNIAAFDLLKERGMDIISNPELRRKIVEHYTIAYIENEGWFSNLPNVHSLQANRIYDNFKITVDINGRVSMYPRDYSELLENEKFMDPFHHYMALASSGIHILEVFIGETQEVLQLIEDELGESYQKPSR